MMTRPLTFTLCTAVLILALFSPISSGYALWIDSPSTALHILLVAWSLCTVAFAAITRMGRKVVPAARLLLAPTGFVVGILCLNTVHYYKESQAGAIQNTTPPMTLLIAALLVVWVVAALWPQHITESNSPGKPRRLGRLGNALAWTANVLLLLFGLWFFFFAFTQNPPPPYQPGMPPRLAVVFGNMVLPNGMPAQIMRDRTLAAVDLYHRGQVQKLLLSGACSGQDGRGPNEPAAMKRLCLQQGIPENAILLDPVGFNTRASAESTRQLLKNMPGYDVVAVSTASHLPRIRVAFRQLGIPCYSVACPTPDWTPEDPIVLCREMVGTPMYMFVPSYRPSKGAAMGITHPRLVVTKSKNLLEVYDGTRLARTYGCITGTHPGDKEIEGDRKTPLGTFHIVYKNPESKFHLSMGLDYPNAEDCARGIKAGLITEAQASDILAAAKSDLSVTDNQNRLWKSPLGGEIFIHGHAEGRNNTAGCIAVTNPEIEELYAICEVGTEVEIRP